MSVSKIKAITQVDGSNRLLRPETVANQVICYLENGSEIRLDELLNNHAEKINELEEKLAYTGFVLRITFDHLFAGKNFTVSGGEFSYTGIVPGGLRVTVQVPEPNATYTVTSDNFTTSIETTNYFGIYDITLNSIPAVFADATWEQVGMASASGNIPSSWKVGDTKNFIVAGENLTLQIYAKNHDDLVGGGKAPLTLGLKNLMATKRGLTEGYDTNTNGLAGTQLYTWLSNSLLSSFPIDLQNIIKSANKKTSIGGGSSGIRTEAMKLFLPSEIECTGSSANSLPGEGAQYPIFTNDASRIKYLSNGSGTANAWWTRSPRSSSTTNFCNILNNGSASSSISSVVYGVCFMFCI